MYSSDEITNNCRETAVRALAAWARCKAVGGERERRETLKTSLSGDVFVGWATVPTRWYLSIDCPQPGTLEFGPDEAVKLGALLQQAAADAEHYLRAAGHEGGA